MDYLNEREAAGAGELLRPLRAALQQVLFGREELIDLLICGVLARGHILLEGLPGLGKTELAKGLAKALELDTRRIQFTPDLLPGDITGNPVLEDTRLVAGLYFSQGPLFASLLLADEINRASPKTQSALLEAMQERRVTVLGTTHVLPEPFFVLATQNPIELEGTYPLPEAQVDRFLFKLEVVRSDAAVLEKIVLNRELGVEPEVPVVMNRRSLLDLMALTRRVFLPEVVANYIARLVDATHPGRSQAAAAVKFGASPRAALSLASAIKARALMAGRLNAFEDVQAVAHPVLAHRLILDYGARMDGRTPRDVVAALLKEVPVQDLKLPSLVRDLTRN